MTTIAPPSMAPGAIGDMNMMSVPRPLPGQKLVTPDDKSALIVIGTWLPFMCAFLTVAVRATTKRTVFRKLGMDDWLMLAAIGIAVTFQSQNGLGVKMSTVDAHMMSIFEKANYVSELLYVAIICLAKLSVLSWLFSITPARRHHILIYSTGTFIIIWAFAGELVVALQCHAPHVWAVFQENCVDETVFWDWFTASDVLTDTMLILIPSYIVYDLQMSHKRKIAIVASFACRVFAIAAAITRLTFFNQIPDARGETFLLWKVVITTECEQAAAIMASCIPFLKPFVQGLESGVFRSTNLRRLSQGQSYRLSDLMPSPTNSHCDGTSDAACKDIAGGSPLDSMHFPSFPTSGKGAVARNDLWEIGAPFDGRKKGCVTTTVCRSSKDRSGGKVGFDGRQSAGSRVGMITQTMGWKVENDRCGGFF
ncbi:hypothetical protein MMC25_004193 [Agyrium rufum]|nr:hypothetical protein [Agyrium rufum]